MPKLIDLAGVHGKSNGEIVTKLISNVFEHDKRFIQDFNESVDLLMGLIKTKFKEYHKVCSMIKGEYIRNIEVKD